MRSLFLSLLFACSSACSLAPSAVPDAPYLVTVKGVRIPERSWLPWFTRFADHLWIDAKDAAGWHRFEWNQHIKGVRAGSIPVEWARADVRWGREVRVVAVFAGTPARSYVAGLREHAAAYPFKGGYLAWPGPNSNTFVDWLARRVGLPVDLPTTSIGRDYTPYFRAGGSTSRTGVELQTILAGAKVGVREGVEVQALGLVVGVSLWPPALKLPFLPAFPVDWNRRGSARTSARGR